MAGGLHFVHHPVPEPTRLKRNPAVRGQLPKKGPVRLARVRIEGRLIADKHGVTWTGPSSLRR